MRVTLLVLALSVAACAVQRERSFAMKLNKHDKLGDMKKRARMCKRGSGAPQCRRRMMANRLFLCHSVPAFFF